MSARPKFAPQDQMTIEEFLAFTETRPDEERWELIEGVPVLNASPVDFHQIVVTNIVTHLMIEKRRSAAPWLPMIGIGTRVPISPNSLPQPDVFVMAGRPAGLPARKMLSSSSRFCRAATPRPTKLGGARSTPASPTASTT